MVITKRVSEQDVLYNLTNLRQLVIEVTDSCNLRCLYCAYRELYQDPCLRKKGNLSFEDIKPLLDYLLDLWSNKDVDKKTDIGFYGGEPLLNFELIHQIIDYFERSKSNKKFSYSMTTNGLLLDKYMDYLVEKDFDIVVSLDGDKRGQSFRIKPNGVNSFDDVYKNVIFLKERHPSFFDKNVNFHSIIHCNNSVQEVIDYISSNFKKIPSFAEISPNGIREDKRDLYKAMYKNINDSIQQGDNPDLLIRSIGDENPGKVFLYQYLKAYSGNIYETYNSLIAGIDSCRTPSGTCHPFQMKMFVTVNGEILQCEQIPRETKYGSVSRNGLNLELVKVASNFNSLLDRIQPECNSCAISSSCPTCLFYIDGFPNKIKCQNYKNSDQFFKYQDSCLSLLKKNPALYNMLIKEMYVG